jgi:hypothetical protein
MLATRLLATGVGWHRRHPGERLPIPAAPDHFSILNEDTNILMAG